jgi:hypothetical protein
LACAVRPIFSAYKESRGPSRDPGPEMAILAKRRYLASRLVSGSGAPSRQNVDSVGPKMGEDMSLGDSRDPGNLDAATLQQYLPGARFPAEKEQIASTAEGNGAPQELVEKIRNASRERFNGPDEVLQEIQSR